MAEPEISHYNAAVEGMRDEEFSMLKGEYESSCA